jgi:hypothetical protein
MDLKSLIGQTFHENQIYELLQFDIEENIDSYMGKYYLMYYELLPEGYLMMTELLESYGHDEHYKIIRRDLGKRAFLHIYEHYKHVDLHLCRADATGKLSVIRKTHTHFQEVNGWSFADEGVDPNRPKLTPEQKRQAFRELMGIFDTHEQMSKSKTKIPI